MTHYVYSTLSADVHYTTYHKPEVLNGRIADVPRVDKVVKIRGGANVAPVGIRRLETPLGIATKVTDEEMEILNNHPVFKTHKDNGYITHRKSKVDAEVAAADMESRDISAPIVEADMVKYGNLDEGEVKKEVKPTGRFNKTVLKNTLQ